MPCSSCGGKNPLSASTPKWEEEFDRGIRKIICRNKLYDLNTLSTLEFEIYEFSKDFIRSTRDEAYVEGYKAGGGDLGKRVGAEYVGFQEKIDEAVREERERMIDWVKTETLMGGPSIIGNLHQRDWICKQDLLRRLEERKEE